MKPARSNPKNDQSMILLRRYNQLKEAALGSLSLMDRMQAEGALRLPFQGYEESVAALRKAIG